MAVKRWNGTAWEVYSGADLAPVKVTDGRVGKTTFIGATSPTGQVDGDIWIDQDTTTNAVVPTALTTKGDTFAATGNAAYTRLAAGNNGESLFADSSTNTGLRWKGDYNIGKNKIINGAFDIWQRGVTFAGGQYGADRFYSGTGSNNHTVTQVAGIGGSRYAAKITQTGSNSFTQFGTQIEFNNCYDLQNQTVSVSFWAQANNTNSGSTALTTRTRTIAGIDGACLFTGSNNDTSFTITTTPIKYTLTKLLPATFGSLSLEFATNAGVTGDGYTISNIQLELGSVPTSFSRAGGTIAGELAACQRYFQTLLNSTDSIYENLAVGTAWVSNRILYNRPITTMRVSPSISISAVGDFTVENGPAGGFLATSYDTFDLSSRHISGSFYCAGTPFTPGHSARIRASATANARYYLSAEL